MPVKGFAWLWSDGYTADGKPTAIKAGARGTCGLCGQTTDAPDLTIRDGNLVITCPACRARPS